LTFLRLAIGERNLPGVLLNADGKRERYKKLFISICSRVVGSGIFRVDLASLIIMRFLQAVGGAVALAGHGENDIKAP